MTERIAFPYVDGRYVFTMPDGYEPVVNFWAWGGGGGAGGNSPNAFGGYGSSGVLVSGSFTAQPGDVIEVVPGGGGQAGDTFEQDLKLGSVTIPGVDGLSAPGGPGGAFGYVVSPNNGNNPEYTNWLPQLVNNRWSSGPMLYYAVAGMAWNDYSEQQVDNRVYFPEPGVYSFGLGTSRTLDVFFISDPNVTPIRIAPQLITRGGQWQTSSFVDFRVPAAGIYTISYILRNTPPGGPPSQQLPYLETNPPAVAITITRNQPSSMGSMSGLTTNIVWCTRFGRDVSLTDRVPVYAAPLIANYVPQRGEYGWGISNDQRAMAFLRTDTTWTSDDLANLGLTFDQVYQITNNTTASNASAATIKGHGSVVSIAVGYYVFKRGQSWADARYCWTGNQEGTWGEGSIPMQGVNVRGKSLSAYQTNNARLPPVFRNVFGQLNSGGRGNVTTYDESKPFCTFNIPKPAADEIYILAFMDTSWFANPSNYYNGTSNLTFTAFATTAQTWQGGAGGKSRQNLKMVSTDPVGQNYFGGWGGQVGNSGSNPTGKTGGGGGGGGATLILLEKGSNTTASNISPASIGCVAHWFNNFIERAFLRNLIIRNWNNEVLPTNTWWNGSTTANGVNLTNGAGLASTINPPGTSPGKPEIAATFNASASSFFSCGTTPSLNISGLDATGNPKPFTIEAWIYATGAGSNATAGGMIVNKDYEYEVARWADGRVAIAVDWGQGAWLSTPGSGWMITPVVVPLNTAAFVSVVFTSYLSPTGYGNQELRPVSLDGRWSVFMNTHAVWPVAIGLNSSYNIYRTFNAPYTGVYQFHFSGDNQAVVYVNGVNIGTTFGGESAFKSTRVVAYTMSAGANTIQIYVADWGVAAGVALIIYNSNTTEALFNLRNVLNSDVPFLLTGDCILYINGVRRWQCSVDGYLDSNNTRRYICYRYRPVRTDQEFYVGQRTQRNQGFQGYIGNVRLWNVARTQQQIVESMNTIPRQLVVTRFDRTRIAIAGGGGGGGGAKTQPTSQDQSQNAFNAFQAPGNIPSYGKFGGSPGGQAWAEAGGGGGGGGTNGAVGGNASSGRRQSTGGYQGGYESGPGFLTDVVASYVMVGRGGDGGIGGGGGAGELRFGDITLNETMTINVGGTTDGDAGASFIDNGTIKLVAGKGGAGGYANSPWGGRSAAGQQGGCDYNSNKVLYGGSGGGGSYSVAGGAGAAGGKANTTIDPVAGPRDRVLPGTRATNSFTNAGGKNIGFAHGGGGGAGSAGTGGTDIRAPALTYKSGNGGNGRTVTLGKSGFSYTLAAGGGGAASFGTPGIDKIGQGGGDIGGWGETGTGGGAEFTVPGTYRFVVPPGVTSITVTATAGGGCGGGVFGRLISTSRNLGFVGGGGGAGAFVDSTSYEVRPGSTITVTVGAGGRSNTPGGVPAGDTLISGLVGQNIVLKGGLSGFGGPLIAIPNTSVAPIFQATGGKGGNGGTPNGSPGQDGRLEAFEYISGDGGGGLNPGGGGVRVAEPTTTARPSNTGPGTGGGGGYYFVDSTGRQSQNIPGAVGGNGYVNIVFEGFSGTIPPVANTGSGGGGGYSDLGTPGATGFVAISYPGPPVMIGGDNTYTQRNFTVHEFYSSGTLRFSGLINPGAADTGVGSTPGGQEVEGYIPGTAVGGRRQEVPSIIPVTDSSYVDLLKNHGVWNNEAGNKTLKRFYTWYAPATGRYIIQAAANAGGYVWLNDSIVFNMTPITRGNGTYYSKNVQTTEKKFTAGQGVLIQWDITSLSAPGAFAMTIARVETPTAYLFDSRDPPLPSGGPNGGDGLVLLELTPRAIANSSSVKVDDEYKNVLSIHTKVNGQWLPVRTALTKVNGVWKGIFGITDELIPNILTTDYGVAASPATPTAPRPSWGGGGGSGEIRIYGVPAYKGIAGPITVVGPSPPTGPPAPSPSPPSSPPSGGGGGCKVICQKLAELGYFDAAMNEADQAFGILLRDSDPDAYNGYLRWAGPVVDLLEGKGSATFRKVVLPWVRDEQRRQQIQINIVAYYLDGIARPWAEEMAYRMKAEGYNKSNPAGKFIMDVGLPMCRLISKFNRGGKMPMWAKTALIWGTTTVLLSIVTVISTTDKVIQKVKNFFKTK